ncbi:hypothetical protein T492DRAFT_988783 [Pavlovales sp. CCMP2436]|nr:hypothetical protein T492DRAFT_988783 [Pavlovales sp. CCMP2436]
MAKPAVTKPAGLVAKAPPPAAKPAAAKPVANSAAPTATPAAKSAVKPVAAKPTAARPGAHKPAATPAAKSSPKPLPPPAKATAQPADKDAALETVVAAAAAAAGVEAAAAAAAAGVEAAAAALAAFSLADKDGDGHLNFREFAGFVKVANEEVAYLDDSSLPIFIKKEFVKASSKEVGGTTHLLSPAEFEVWHAAFLAARDTWEEELAAKRAAARVTTATESGAAALPPARFGGDGVWEVKLDALQLALESAYALKRTPLLIDATGDEVGGTTALETFYAYSGHQLLELKKMVVEVNVRKIVSLEDALRSAREKLVLALKRGCTFMFLLSNSAPPLRSKFCTPTELPVELFDNSLVQAMRGYDGDLKGSFLGKVIVKEDQLMFAHADFNVAVVTRFPREDYEQFLREELPLELMQPIVVTINR